MLCPVTGQLGRISLPSFCFIKLALKSPLLFSHVHLKFFFQFKRRQRCRLCNRSNGVVRNDGDRCILIDFSGTSNARKLKKQPLRVAPLENIENIEGQEVDAG